MENEQIIELEREIEVKETQYEQEVANSSEKDIGSSSIRAKLELQIKTLEGENMRIASSLNKQLTDMKKTHENLLNGLNTEASKSQTALKSSTDELKLQESKFTEESALFSQQIEFLQQELEGAKQQLQDERKNQELMVKSLQFSNSNTANGDLSAQIDLLNSSHIQEMHNSEEKHREHEIELTSQVTTLSKENEELKLTFKVTERENSTYISSVKEDNKHLNEQQLKLTLEVTHLKDKLNRNSEKLHESLSSKTKFLEQELENTRNQYSEELSVCKQTAESNYTSLKESYEQERERLESKLRVEKGKAAKKYSAACDEYEQRLREESEHYEEELLENSNKLHDLESHYTEQLSTLEQTIDLKKEKIIELELQLKHSKDSLVTHQNSQISFLEQQKEKLETENTVLSEKVLKLNKELAGQNHQFTTLLYNSQQYESNLALKSAELTETLSEHHSQLSTLNEKLESFRAKYQSLTEEYAQHKSDNKRENALLQQNLTFKTRELAESRHSIQDSQSAYTESLQLFKAQSLQEHSESLSKLSQESALLTVKLEEKRKALKSFTFSSNKQTLILEKEKLVIQEKYEHLQVTSSEAHSKLHCQVLALTTELREAHKKSIASPQFSLESEVLKTQSQGLQKELSELRDSFARETLLHTNKIEFLQQAKTGLAEQLKRTQISFGNFQESTRIELQKLEETKKNSLQVSEETYRDNLAQVHALYQPQLQTLTSKTHNLSTALAAANEQLELEKHSRTAQNAISSKKLAELSTSEQELRAQLALVGSQHSVAIENLQEELTTAKSHYKAILTGLETRAKDSDQQKTLLFLHHERSNSKWTMDREQLISQRTEAVESLSRLEKKCEFLLRDNEKLKAARPQRRSLCKRPGTNLSQSKLTFEEFSQDTPMTKRFEAIAKASELRLKRSQNPLNN